MRIRNLISVLALVSVFAVGAFGQTTSGRIGGIAVDPSDPSGNTFNWTLVTTTVTLLGL